MIPTLTDCVDQDVRPSTRIARHDNSNAPPLRRKVVVLSLQDKPSRDLTNGGRKDNKSGTFRDVDRGY